MSNVHISALLASEEKLSNIEELVQAEPKFCPSALIDHTFINVCYQAAVLIYVN